MRKVILQMSMSLDGYVAGPAGEMDRIFTHSNEVSGGYVHTLLNQSDVIFLGRKMAKEFLNYRPKETHPFAERINALPKVVFSKTRDTAERENVTVSKDISATVAELKQQPGKNLILYGGAHLAQSFMNLGLIDEYHLLIIPIILGGWLHLFGQLKNHISLQLIKATPTEKGVVIMHYEPKRD